MSWNLSCSKNPEFGLRAHGTVEVSCCPAIGKSSGRDGRGESGEDVRGGGAVCVLGSVGEVYTVGEGGFEGMLECG